MANRVIRGCQLRRTSEEVLDTQKMGLVFGRKIGVRLHISYTAPVGFKFFNHVLQVLVKRSIRTAEIQPRVLLEDLLCPLHQIFPCPVTGVCVHCIAHTINLTVPPTQDLT